MPKQRIKIINTQQKRYLLLKTLFIVAISGFMLYNNINMKDDNQNLHIEHSNQVEQCSQSGVTEQNPQPAIAGKNVSYKFKRWMAWLIVGVITFGFVLFNLLCFTVFKQKAVLPTYFWGVADEFDSKDYSTLSADEKGEFCILQLSDMHILNGVSMLDNKTFDLANRLIDYSDPDLIVLTGDTVFTWDNERTLKKVIAFFDEVCKQRKIFWCLVFGNHDETGYVDETVLSELLMQSKYCLFNAGPSNLNDDGKYGNSLGNYAVNIVDAQGVGKCSLIFMDSNASGTDAEEGLYAPISKAAVGWYEWFVNGMAAKNGGNVLPSLAFFHIPLLQNRLMMRDTPLGQNGYHEKVCSSEIDTGLYSKMTELKSTVATFSGHDHQNYYQGYYQDGSVLLTSCVSCGYCTYGDTDLKGGRIIKINVNSNDLDLNTWVIFEKELN